MKASLIATTLLAFAAANAAAQSQQPVSETIVQNAYMIELHQEPGTAGVTIEQDQLRKAIKLMNIPFRERGTLTEAMNSLSIEVDDNDISRISELEQVKRVWPLHTVSQPRVAVTDTPQNATFPYYHAMTGVELLHNKYRLDGEGIKVGVIDSGIDYTHPALGGCFGKGCRVAYGWDFVGDDVTSMSSFNGDSDPLDCGGHGTHVAGIIGARDKSFVGVAPSVTFGAYRVFDCNGKTISNIIARAMERAYIDNMDIINMSLGSDGSWPQEFSAVVAERLTRKGLIVIAAMGNSARNGIWEASSPAVAPNAYSVAALGNVKYRAYTMSIVGDENKRSKIPYVASVYGQRLNFTNTEIVAAEPGNEFGCNPINAKMTGKIALIKRGTCNFVVKALNAQKAGANSVVIYNNAFGILDFEIEDNSVKIPSVGIEQFPGERIAKLFQTGPVKLDFSQDMSEFDNPEGGHITDFSSWGPGPRTEIKPDIGAPGGIIYSTYPMAKGGYKAMSGTSMSTPYVAGAAALYLQAKGLNITRHPVDGSVSQRIRFNTTAQTIDQRRMREAFQNTARPAVDVHAKQRVSSVALQGAGLINVQQAIFGTLHVKPSRLALNDTQYRGNRQGNAQVRTIQITNTGATKRTYSIAHKPAASVRGLDKDGLPPVKPELNDESAIVSFSKNSVTVQPKQTIDVDVYITQPASLPENQLWIFSGYVIIDPATGADNTPSMEAVHVPATLPAIINQETMKIITRQSDTDTYTFVGRNVPRLVFKVDFASSFITASVFNATNDANLGIVPGFTTKWLGRNDVGGNGFYSQTWNGSVIRQDGLFSRQEKLPNGKYYIKIMALRSYGSITKQEDYDVWRSPILEFKRA